MKNQADSYKDQIKSTIKYQYDQCSPLHAEEYALKCER